MPPRLITARVKPVSGPSSPALLGFGIGVQQKIQPSAYTSHRHLQVHNSNSPCLLVVVVTLTTAHMNQPVFVPPADSQLGEVERAMDIVAAEPQRFHVSPAEVQARRSWIR